MSSIMRRRSGLTGSTVIKVSCLKRGEPHDLQTEPDNLDTRRLFSCAAAAPYRASGLVQCPLCEIAPTGAVTNSSADVATPRRFSAYFEA